MARETSRGQETSSQGARTGGRTGGMGAQQGGRGSAGAGAQTSKPADLKLDQLFAEMEERARGWLQSIEGWVNQGDDLLTRSKAWLDEHPVALAMANKYSQRIPNMPRSTEQAKESIRNMGSRVGTGARRTMSSARANPLETALVGGAVGVLAWVALRSSGRSSARMPD